jgi:hypothetical protein
MTTVEAATEVAEKTENKTELPVKKGTHIFHGPSLTPLTALTAHFKMSIRIPNGIVTSLTIKKNIIAMWLIYRQPTPKDSLDLDKITTESIAMHSLLSKDDLLTAEANVTEAISNMISDFVYEKIELWTKETGKGLSDFITDLMIQDILEEDFSLYKFLEERTK